MPKILAITPYPNSSADTRYRITQYIPLLNKSGYKVNVRPFMNEELFKIYSKEGNTLKKYWLTLIRLFSRTIDIFFLAKNYDIVFIHKECFPFGPPIFEQILKLMNKKIIFDMDDAFWTHPPQFKQIGKIIKDPKKTQKIINLSDYIFAGNDYLVDYSARYNKNVVILPTVINTNQYIPALRNSLEDKIIIGWVGRWSSAQYLYDLETIFEKITNNFKNVVFRFIGSGQLNFSKKINYEIFPWKLSTEIKDIQRFDIGIMPLPDDEYSRGKCGFKLIQYMALGIPSVASPVGVNNKIICDGIDGFLANSQQDWTSYLFKLIEDSQLRKSIGENARKKIENKYSLNYGFPIFYRILEKIKNNDTNIAS